MVLRIKRMKIGSNGILALLIIAFATLVRIALIALGWPHTNADESTMGIMAMHILSKGEHPIFFYGQHYMGTLEAYLGAAFFSVFGTSVFALRLGPVLFFALFLANMYLLTSLLYTQKMALITLLVLSLGSSIMLDTEVVALGGYPELLFFGSLSVLLACWLALSYEHYSSPHKKVWRLLAYLCWGLVGGLGFWSDFLMFGFILLSGLLLVVFCWKELFTGAAFFLVLGLVIGAFPLIAYNLHAQPGQDTLAVLRYLHNVGRPQLAQWRMYETFPFKLQLRGTLLTTLPAAIGGPPFCFDAYTHFRLSGYVGPETILCAIVPSNVGVSALALVWSLGFLLLWSISTFQTLRHLWRLRQRTPGHSWTTGEKQAIPRDVARLMLLCSAALTLFLFVSSPISAAYPLDSRYLIGLLISTPAIIAPLWGLTNDFGSLSQQVHSEKSDLSRHIWVPSAIGKVIGTFGLRRGILVLVGMLFLLGTMKAFLEIPTVQVYNQQQDALVQDLTRMKITLFYADYWTCDSIVFLSKEHIICSSVGQNRYLPYVALVKADPYAAYVFPLGASQIPSLTRRMAHSARHYQRFDLDGYVIFRPV
jgi:hypothetical protein